MKQGRICGPVSRCGGEQNIGIVKEKETAKRGLKEHAKAMPKQAVRRGLDDGAERLRGQLRDAAQHGQTDDGGDRFGDAAAQGVRQTVRGAQRFLNGRSTNGSRSAEAGRRPRSEASTNQEVPKESVRTGSPRIRARENAACQAGTDTEGTAAPDSRCQAVKTKEAYLRRHGQTASEPTQMAGQGKQGIIQKQGRTLAEKRADVSARTVRKTVLVDKPASLVEPSRIKTVERSSRRGAKAVEGVSGKCVKTAVSSSGRGIKASAHSAGKGIKTADQAMRTARKTALTAAKPAQTAAAKTVMTTVKTAVKASVSSIKSILAATRSLKALLLAGCSVAGSVVLVITLAGMVVASCFGLFFSGEDSGSGITTTEAVAQLNQEFSEQIEQIITDNPHDTLDMDNSGSAAVAANWNDVLAVYAVSVTTDPDESDEVATMNLAKFAVLQGLFWEMNEISYSLETVTYTETTTNEDGEEEETTSTETILHITVAVTDAWQMADQLGFTDEQREQLDEMLQLEHLELFQKLTGSYQDIALSPEEVQAIIDRLPAGLSAERRQVVLTAYQLLGRVNHFWGGKSLVLGWDSRWGLPQEVWAAGSATTGTVRPFGLDCSGFIDWVFYNVSGGTYVLGHGGGAAAQHTYCTEVSWSEAIPGDLVFYPGDTHVGIVCGFDESGNVLIIHCSYSANNVVVTGQSGFMAIARPSYYTE